MSETGKTGRGRWVDPLTRPIIAATVPSSGLDFRVKASDAERAALARALNLNAVVAAEAQYQLTRKAGGRIALTGRLVAEVEPICVVTLEAFTLRLDEPVEMSFTEAEADAVAAIEHDLDREDPPDVIENGVIDLGRVTTEFLSLAIPPFPRKPEAVFENAGGAGEESPFAVLKGLPLKRD